MVCASLAFIDGLGGPEMVLIFIIVLVLFGGQKLPEFARGFGKSIREFKKAAAGVEEEFKRALEEDERKNATPKLAAAAVVPVSTDDPAGPESTSSPVTDEGGPNAPESSSHHDGSYDDGSHYEDADQAPGDVPASSSETSPTPEASDTPAEPTILPPAPARPKTPSTPPADAYENPS